MEHPEILHICQYNFKTGIKKIRELSSNMYLKLIGKCQFTLHSNTFLNDLTTFQK